INLAGIIPDWMPRHQPFHSSLLLERDNSAAVSCGLVCQTRQRSIALPVCCGAWFRVARYQRSHQAPDTLFQGTDGFLQGVARLGTEQMGITNAGARPIKAMFPDGEMPPPFLLGGVERHEKARRHRRFRPGPVSTPDAETRIAVIALVLEYPGSESWEGLFHERLASLNLGFGKKHRVLHPEDHVGY